MTERFDLLTLRDINKLGYSRAVIDMTGAEAAARCRKKGLLDGWNRITHDGEEALRALEKEVTHGPP